MKRKFTPVWFSDEDIYVHRLKSQYYRLTLCDYDDDLDAHKKNFKDSLEEIEWIWLAANMYYL